MYKFNRLLYLFEGQRLNPLIYPFFVIMAANGIAFTFFGNDPTVSDTILFKLTTKDFGARGYLNLWGIAAMVVILATILVLLLRPRCGGGIVAWCGFAVWGYAFTLYLIDGYWLQMISASAQMYFWAFYYFRVKQYQDQIHFKPFEE